MLATCEYGEELENVSPAGGDGATMCAPSVLDGLIPGLLPGDLPWLPQVRPHGHRNVPYDEKLITADEAAAKVLSGQRVYIGSNCGEPASLMQALMKRANTLRNVEITH